MLYGRSNPGGSVNLVINGRSTGRITPRASLGAATRWCVRRRRPARSTGQAASVSLQQRLRARRQLPQNMSVGRFYVMPAVTWRRGATQVTADFSMQGFTA
jgi:hypothetical protein